MKSGTAGNAGANAPTDFKAERFLPLARKPRFVVLAARGTSDNAALFGRYLIEISTGIPVSLAAPSVHTLYDARPIIRMRS